MEFFQFHPTGIAGKGMLISEGVRGEADIWSNRDGERFMERYAPHAMDLPAACGEPRHLSPKVREGPQVRSRWARSDHVLLRSITSAPAVTSSGNACRAFVTCA